MARANLGRLAAGAALLAVGLYLVAVNGGTWAQAMASRGWPSTTGQVLSSDLYVVVTEAGAPREYAARISYTYLVDGRRHEANRVSFARGSLRAQGDIVALVRQYPEGARVRVFYDPREPGQAVLEPGAPAPLYALVGAGAAAVVGGLGLCAWAFSRPPDKPAWSRAEAADEPPEDEEWASAEEQNL